MNDFDGIEKLRDAAQSLVDLAADYPNGQTKAMLLRAAAEIYAHAEDANFRVESPALAVAEWLRSAL